MTVARKGGKQQGAAAQSSELALAQDRRRRLGRIIAEFVVRAVAGVLRHFVGGLLSVKIVAQSRSFQSTGRE